MKKSLPVIVCIQDLETREQGCFEDELYWEWWDEESRTWGCFYWEEGNASCDCNREMWVEESLGRPAKEFGQYKCGDARYRVLYVADAVTGEIIYEEDENREPIR